MENYPHGIIKKNAKKTNFYSVNGIILNNLDGTKKSKWRI